AAASAASLPKHPLRSTTAATANRRSTGAKPPRHSPSSPGWACWAGNPRRRAGGVSLLFLNSANGQFVSARDTTGGLTPRRSPLIARMSLRRRLECHEFTGTQSFIARQQEV